MKQVLEEFGAIWQKGGKTAFLGVGSPLRADDAAGLYLVAELEAILKKARGRDLRFYLGEAAPENFSGAIREFAPENLVLTDAALMGEAPGTIKLIDPARLGSTGFATHSLPLKILTDYLTEATGCAVTVIGIEPRSLEFDHPLSEEVKCSVDGFVAELKQLLSL